jgi:hypothetical protein
VSMTSAAGPVETSVRAAAARIAVTARVLVVLACTALLPLGGATAASAVVVGAVLVWQAAFVATWRWLPRAVLLDCVPLAVACILLPWWHPQHGYLDLDDWARPVTSVCVGAAQFYTRPRDGSSYVLVTSAALMVGSTLAADSWNLHTAQAVMLLWQAGLARCLIVLVTRGARRVDELTGVTAGVRRDAELAAARRADFEEHLAVLHDTVAATLTAASSPGAGGPALRRRARADLALLEPGPPREVTFADLTTAPGDCAIGIAFERGPAHGEPAIPPYAIGALLAARDEALRNVERHAGTGQARVRIGLPAPGAVELEVIDDGRGFRPDDVPDGGRLGLRLSVHARVRRAGGSARVISAPGRGTRVELRWPAA